MGAEIPNVNSKLKKGEGLIGLDRITILRVPKIIDKGKVLAKNELLLILANTHRESCDLYSSFMSPFSILCWSVSLLLAKQPAKI